MDPDPVCPERLNADPDPGPVNIRLDPKRWLIVICEGERAKMVSRAGKLPNFVCTQ